MADASRDPMATRTATTVTIVLSDLACGGIQRAAIINAGGLAHRGYAVTLLTFSDGSADFFAVPDKVVRVPLGLKSATPTPFLKLLPGARRKLRALRTAVLASEPDVVIAHAPQVNVPTLFALGRTGLPLIVTEHGDVPAVTWKKAAWYRLRRWCYPFAFRVVSVSEAVDRNVSWLPRARRAIVPNPVVVPAARPANDQAANDQAPRDLAAHGTWGTRGAQNGDLVVSMGRLAHAKGFDLLIAAYARIAADFPHWRLVILGDGELRPKLEQQVRDLHLSERVLFAGAVADPSEWLRRAKLFVMASRYEGFPLAHAEALACGLPVIATDCPSRPLLKGERFVAGGVRELIRRKADGVLVPAGDPVALAHAMADLMSSDTRRNEFSAHSAEVVARFSSDKILDEWECLIQHALASSIAAKTTRGIE